MSFERVAKPSPARRPAEPAAATMPNRTAPLQRVLRTATSRTNTHDIAKIGGTQPIQRDIENDTYNDDDTDNIELAEKFFELYNGATKKAYNFVVTVPSLGGYAKLDGQTALWSRKWAEHLANQRPQLLAATFGYVIESLVSNAMSEFYPGSLSGCTVLPQVVVGGTRPDLVLVKGGKHIAWLDLTAEASADHIFDKDGWDNKVANFAEVTYPSLDLATLALMKQNKDNTGAISEEEFEKRKKKANEEYRKRKRHWMEIGDQFAYRNLSGELTNVYGFKKSDLQLQPEILRNYIKDKLEAYFKQPIDMKLVPSILLAMFVGSTSWGFQTGFSQSEKAGEAWLIDYAPLPSGN